jgi:hypothetical protein
LSPFDGVPVYIFTIHSALAKPFSDEKKALERQREQSGGQPNFLDVSEGIMRYGATTIR